MTTETIKLSTYNPAEYNPRDISEAALSGLKASLSRFGDLSGIVLNKRTGNYVTGHQRLKTIIKDLDPDISIDWLAAPDTDGSIGWGFLTIGNTRYSVRVVDWEIDKEKVANISANNPHIQGTFTDDLQLMLSEIDDKALLEGLNMGDLINALDLANEIYSRKIKSPVYKAQCETPPPICDLYNEEKANGLVERIKKAEMPPDVQAFLEMAAKRHVIFNYKNIAEYYCHASPEIQELMEESALIIIDFKKAIEQGYVKFWDSMEDLFSEDYPVNDEA